MKTKADNRNPGFEKIVKTAAVILFLIYLSFLIYLTLFSRYYGRGLTNVYRSINLLPFKTIIQYATSSFNRNIIVTNLLGNILAFVPMGFLIPWFWKRLSRFIYILLAIAAASLIIEVAQYITGAGSADIDDLILNTAGGILGYGFYYLLNIKGHFFT